VTIKSRDGGLARDEFEYPVPLADANSLLRLCGPRILEKIRHEINYASDCWEVDEYLVPLEDLVIAEVESEGENPPRPPWIGEDITRDGSFSNAASAQPIEASLRTSRPACKCSGGLWREDVYYNDAANGSRRTMTSPEDHKKIAIAYVTHIANGGIDEKHIASDMVAWSLSSGDMPKSKYWPRLKHVQAIFTTPLAMTIDEVTQVKDRVFIQSHSRGLLYTGNAYSNDYFFVIDFNDAGQIRRAREYFDVDKLRTILMPALLSWESENVR
jgi:ketosteroid isomerase-like protein